MKQNKLVIFIITLTMILAVSFGSSCLLGNSSSAGLSAYQIAVQNGFSGTEAEWLESLKGKNGADAKPGVTSLFEEWKNQEGNENKTFDDFMKDYLPDYISNEASSDLSKVADTALLSTVKVVSTFKKYVISYDYFGNRSYSEQAYTGEGAGVIASLDTESGNAYIITNYHVVHDANSNVTKGVAESIKVYVYGREYDAYAVSATIVGATATYDIAVLEITGSEVFRSEYLRAVEFGNSNLIGAGDSILAVGNPEAAGISATAGIVSVDSEYITMTSPKDEKTEVRYRVIRIDAAVNGGNSGGGLFDINGKLIGIVNAKIVSTKVDNIAYAIPSSIVENVYNNILKNCNGTKKQVVMANLGVTFQISSSYAYYDALLLDTRISEEVTVSSVSLQSPANGLLEEGDVITAIKYEGKEITVTRLFNVTDAEIMFEKGKTVKFRVVRNDKPLEVSVTLSSSATID